MTSRLRAILFDVDGTLIDTVSLIVEALDRIYQKYLGLTLPADEIRATIGLPLTVQMHLFDDRVLIPVDYEKMMTEHIEYYEANKHREFPIAEALEAVRRCKQNGYRVALVTSKNRFEMDFAMPRLELDDFVDTVITASDAAHPKPAPDPALTALEQLKIAPDEAIFIGDTEFDIACGKGAGTYTAAVNWGAHSELCLREAAPDLLFHSPRQLLDWCDSLPKLTTHAPSKEKDTA